MESFDLPEDYRFVCKLGEGASATVVEALHLTSERRVAIKVLKSQVSAKWYERFRSEAQTLAGLEHSAIQKVYRFGYLSDKRPYFVTELLTGETLEALLTRQDRLSFADLLEIFPPLCNALQMIHARGIVHRDIKPANIFLCNSSSQYKPMLMDFGLAKDLDADKDQSLTESGELPGTPLYISPEQCKGKPATAAADVFSLGCIMYECLNGELPWSGQTGVEVMSRKLTDSPRPFAANASVPRKVRELIMQMLHSDPGRRPSLRLVSETLAACSEDDIVPVSRLTAGRPLVLIILATLLLMFGTVFSIRTFSPPHDLTLITGLKEDQLRMLVRSIKELRNGDVRSLQLLQNKLYAVISELWQKRSSNGLLFAAFSILAHTETMKEKWVGYPSQMRGPLWIMALNCSRTANGQPTYESGVAEYGIGEWYETRSQWAEALQHLQRAFEHITARPPKHLSPIIDPPSVQTETIMYKIGWLRAALGDEPHAVATIERCLHQEQKKPSISSIRAITWLANNYYKRGRKDEYEAALNRLEEQMRLEGIKEKSEAIKLFLVLIQSQILQGHSRRAAAECRMALHFTDVSSLDRQDRKNLLNCCFALVFPSELSSLVHYELRSLSSNGQFDTAANILQKFKALIESDPEHASAATKVLYFAESAHLCLMMRNPSEAKKWFNQSMSLWRKSGKKDGTWTYVNYQLIKLSAQLGDANVATELSKPLLYELPQSQYFLVYGPLGMALLRTNRENARINLIRAMEYYRDNPKYGTELLRQVFVSLVIANQSSAASMLEVIPGTVDCTKIDGYLFLGEHALLQKNELSSAQKYFNRAYQLICKEMEKDRGLQKLSGCKFVAVLRSVQTDIIRHLVHRQSDDFTKVEPLIVHDARMLQDLAETYDKIPNQLSALAYTNWKKTDLLDLLAQDTIEVTSELFSSKHFEQCIAVIEPMLKRVPLKHQRACMQITMAAAYWKTGRIDVACQLFSTIKSDGSENLRHSRLVWGELVKAINAGDPTAKRIRDSVPEAILPNELRIH